MQKKLLIVAACMIAILVVVGIAVTSQTSENRSQIAQILQENSEEKTALVSLEEVRKEADVVIEAGRNGEYRNLQFDEIRPLITEEDQIYQIKVYSSSVPVTEENLQKALDMLETLLKEPIDEKRVEVIMSPVGLGRISVEKLREEIQNQNEDYMEGWYTLFYLNEELEQCAQIDSAINSLWIDRGMEGTSPMRENELDQVYYIGMTDESLQDVYETVGGRMSVAEAIEQVESYFGDEFPTHLLGDMEYQVARIYILKMPDGKYGFDCAMRRSYKGVPFEHANSGTAIQERDDVHELAKAVLDREEHVLFFNGIACNRNVEKIEEISKVISLERATEYISQKIADNTVYTVKEIELSYMGKKGTDEDGNYYELWTPKWIFFTTNGTSGKDVRFYVDVMTGEVETREIRD
ncbi:MAG: hypothetical protein HDQ95_00200 [Roseburia sp.]|nr:hypothetical protein [Roseburia sp.]